MDLLREKLKAQSHARLHGGGGGGGGGGDIGDGVSPSAGPGAGPGAPGTGPSSNSDVGEGNSSPGASGGMPGIGLGVTNVSTMGLQGLGLAMGLPTVGLSGMATLGNAINGVTGFGGGTPSSSIGDPTGGGGGMWTPTGWVPDTQATNEPYTGIFPFGVDGSGGPAGSPSSLYGTAPTAGGIFPFGVGGFGAFGSLPGMPGAPSPAAPAPSPTAAGSPEEQALRAAQLDLVNRQRDIAAEQLRRQNLMEGELMRSQGYEQVLDETGRVTGYRPTADLTSRQNSENEINNLLRTRTLAALKGELPVDPALERSIAENRATLESSLRGNLGSGYATSTPGSVALADYEKRAEELRQAQRRDQLTTGEGIRLAGEDLNSRIGSSRFSNVMGLGNAGAGAAGLFSQAGAGLTPSLQNILGNTQLSTNDALQRYLGQLGSANSVYGQQSANNRQQQQLSAADNAGMGQILGSLGSAYLSNPGTFGSIFSSIGSGLGSLGSGIGDFFGGLFG